jgi:hypothetical protein
MRKFTFAAVAAISIACTSFAWSQQAAVHLAQTPPMQPARWTPADTAAFTDARMAALKVGLALRPDQETIWTTFETAYRDLAKQRAERVAQARSEPPPPDPAAYLRRRADAMAAASMTLKRLADAVDPLYRSLDDSQKRRLVAMIAIAQR